MFKLIEYEELNSTNKFALENIASIPDKTVVRAQVQTAGRGRFVRKWVSDKKNNCYISFVLKPTEKFQGHYSNITQYLSVVIADLLEEMGVKPEIKWPNDILIDGKKIVGILSEVSFTSDRLNGIVLGVGINLNLTQDDLACIGIPATSLNIELNKEIDSNVFINKLLERFFEKYDLFLAEGFTPFRAKYISYANFIGKDITIKNPEVQNIGMGLNVAEDGALEILTPEGEIKKILSGDVLFNN